GASMTHGKPVRPVSGRTGGAGWAAVELADYFASALCASAMASAFFSVALAWALALSALAEAIFFWAFSSASIAVFCSFRSALATFSSALALALTLSFASALLTFSLASATFLSCLDCALAFFSEDLAT